MASDATKSHIFQQLFSIKILTKLSYWVYIFLDEILKYIAKMPKKPFSLRSVPGTDLKNAKKMKKFDREVLPHPKSRKSVFSVRDSLRWGEAHQKHKKNKTLINFVAGKQHTRKHLKPSHVLAHSLTTLSHNSFVCTVLAASFISQWDARALKL
jgi:hypothetical protein